MIESSETSKQGPHLFYGYDRLPGFQEVASGGIIKFQRLSDVFPNKPKRFNILYMVSSYYPTDAELIKKASQRKGSKFVWNQDGVAYPAWMPSGWEETNAKMAAFLHDADYVFYQSEFAKKSSDNFLGKRSGPSEILYNAVDTNFFYPLGDNKLSNNVDLLSAGSKYIFDRIETPIRTLSFVRKYNLKARLLFAGKIKDELIDPTRDLISELKLSDHVKFLPPFPQQEAPEIFRKCDIFLHPKINDPCPGIVIEAMACGLPVIYSNSGGVPELVGEDAGIGVDTELSWEHFTQPSPEKWAESVMSVIETYSSYADAARQQAVDRFDLQPWIERHKQVFDKLLGTV